MPASYKKPVGSYNGKMRLEADNEEDGAAFD
jgi:hypothetical protein